MSSTPRRPHLAVATCEAYPDLDDDWPPLRAALADLGVTATACVWTDPTVDWSAFDAVVVRGIWDYLHRPDALGAWIEAVDAVTRLANPGAVLTWNLDKRYLADLAADGVPVVPTVWVEPGRSWEPPAGEFVIKPVISAGGHETARYGSSDADADAARAHVQRLAERGTVAMAQPYLPGVDGEGETALIYLGGRFSHAIRKGPLLAPGEGVVVALHDREVISARTPTTAQLAIAERALAAATARTGTTTYARVDLVPGFDGAPMLLELELLEPALFLGYDEGAVDRFARVLAELAFR